MKAVMLGILLTSTTILAGCANEPAFETLGTRDWKVRLDETPHAFILDVRTPEEFEAGHIPEASLIPYTELEARQSELPQDKSTPLFVYCRSGNRSTIASETLVELGYTNVVNMDGGFPDWARAGYPTA